MKFYVCVTKAELDQLNEDGYLEYLMEEDEDKMSEWLYAQLAKRMPVVDRLEKVLPRGCVGPHWLIPDKSHINVEWRMGKYILEIEKDVEDVLFLNDYDWCTVFNSIMNDCCRSYLAYSEIEAKAMANASAAQIEKSWERIFDIDSPHRDIEYCGPVLHRAITPCIDLGCVKSVTCVPKKLFSERGFSLSYYEDELDELLGDDDDTGGY